MFPILPVAIGAAAVVLILVIILSYVKAPPDHAYLISGVKKEPRLLVGRAGIRIPFFERLDRLYLGQMSVDIKTDRPVPTNDFINVSVDAVAKIRIMPTPAGIALAAKNFLNKSAEQIAMDLMDSLQGNMREIVGTLSLKDINTDRDSFSDEVVNKASKDLAKLGIEIISCNIQNVTDENGLIKDLGADNTAKIKKDASIAKAQADRDVAIAQAQADAAYKIEEQEQQRTIEAATVNAQIAKTEREAELKQREVEVAKQTLDAEIRAKADAEKYRQEKEAEAELYVRQRDAEAKLFEEQKEAEAVRARAEAAKFAKEQEAAGIAAVGKAEAEAIQAKALAEAEGIDKKAEAMKKYGDAAVIEMVMQALPEIAKNVAAPLAQVDKITMYGEGNSAKLLGDIVNGTNQVTEGIAAGMGIDIKALLAGMLGGKIASNSAPAVVIEAPPEKGEPKNKSSKNPKKPD